MLRLRTAGNMMEKHLVEFVFVLLQSILTGPQKIKKKPIEAPCDIWEKLLVISEE